jgi:hypothetical protein
MIVAAILAWLVHLSRCARERVYFALCACSATFGLLRTTFGDVTIPVAQYMRVVLLSSAVALCALILRSHSQVAAEPTLSE